MDIIYNTMTCFAFGYVIGDFVVNIIKTIRKEY